MKQQDTLLQRQTRIFLKSKTGVIGLAVVLLVVMAAIFAPLVAPYDPFAQNMFHRLQGISREHWMGTDYFGRDIVSRSIFGARVSLMVGFLSVLISAALGTFLGIVAGLKGGKFDQVISAGVNIVLSFPTLIMGLLIIAVLGPGLVNVIIALVLTLTPRFIRVARGQTISLKENEFILASRAIGKSDLQIIFDHIVPNIIGTIVVVSTLWMCTAIRIEASLSFLGLGVNPPRPTWGNMIRDGFQSLFDAPWIIAAPAITMMITLLSLNLVGDTLRDVLDPRSN
jgi:peptide/nickel transport system permease protein